MARMGGWLRAALVLAYLVLAHLASVSGDTRVAALALMAIVLLALAGPLLRGRPGAWGLLAAAAFASWAWSGSAWLWLPLRLVPATCVALAAWIFARTLVRGRVPLVTRIAAAIEGTTPSALAPAVRAYSKRVTTGWAGLLALLAVFDAWIAFYGTPEQWSWLANIGDYVVIAACFLLEFAWRRHRFPEQPGFTLFLRRMLALGPGFWRTVAAR